MLDDRPATNATHSFVSLVNGGWVWNVADFEIAVGLAGGILSVAFNALSSTRVMCEAALSSGRADGQRATIAADVPRQ